MNRMFKGLTRYKNKRIKAACLLFFAWVILTGSADAGFSFMPTLNEDGFSDVLSFEQENLVSRANHQPVAFEIFIPLDDAFSSIQKHHTLKLDKVSSLAGGVFELGNAKLLNWRFPVAYYQGKLGMWVVRHYEGDMGWLMIEDAKGVSLYSMKKPKLAVMGSALTWTGEHYGFQQLPKSYTQILVSKDHPIDSKITFKATTLKQLGISGRETIEIHESIGPNLKELFKDAKKNGGHNLICTSGYRSVNKQHFLLDQEIALLTSRGFKDPMTEARKTINLPGQSEHHTGFAVDILSYRILTTDAFYGTKEASWLKEHASNYGFVIRYPEQKTSITGISHEPWHLRYLGKAVAQHLTQKKMTLEEWVLQAKKGVLYKSDDQKMKYYKVIDLKRGGTAWMKQADLSRVKIYYITKDLIGLEFETSIQ